MCHQPTSPVIGLKGSTADKVPFQDKRPNVRLQMFLTQIRAKYAILSHRKLGHRDVSYDIRLIERARRYFAQR